MTPVSDLTAREVEVTRLVVDGLTNLEIGRALCLSPRTVDAHVHHALRKTGMASRTQLAVYALRTGLVLCNHNDRGDNE